MPYSGDPLNNQSDAVRFLVGDTNNNALMLTDNEVLFAINQRGPGLGAAWFCANALQAKFARQVTSTAGKLSKSASDLAKQYAALADKLWRQITIGARPSFGGTTVTQKQRAASDTGAVQPSFTKNQFDNPETAQDTSNENLVIGVNNFP